MDITKFNEKFNKLDGNVYTFEEIIKPVNGVYEADLEHDNINSNTINIYTGSKLTGDKINTYTISTPSLTPWRTHIKIYSTEPTLYITYETVGDTVEADDINNVQDAINDTQNALNDEITRAKNAETLLQKNIDNEANRAKKAENTITTNLNAEITRAKNSENTLTTNLNSEITRAKKAETDLNSIINTNKPVWDDKYTRNEIDNKISQVITDLDWKESVATYADLTTTYPNAQDGWTVNVKDTDITYRYSGTNWIKISANSIPLATPTVDGKMSSSDKSFLDTVRSKWTNITTHISDTVKHITSAERTLWNTVSNKSDKGHTHTKSEITDMPTKVSQFTNDAGYIKSSDSIATSSHTHSNKAVLDKIDQNRIAAWNNKLDKSGGKISNPNYRGQLEINRNKGGNAFAEILYSNGDKNLGSMGFDNNCNAIITDGDNTEHYKIYHEGNKPVKADVGLGNVDNTSDMNKPISTAVQNALNGKLSKSGGVVTGKTLFQHGTGVISLGNGGGTAGYMHVAQIKIGANYQNQPITFSIHQRNGIYGMLVIIFKSLNGPDPELQYIHKIGNIDAYIYKSATSTWELYLQKVEAYDSIDIIELNKGEYMNGTTVTWVDKTITTLPSGSIQAITEYVNVNVAKAAQATQDSDGKQINTTYVKKGMTWNQLEGI